MKSILFIGIAFLMMEWNGIKAEHHNDYIHLPGKTCEDAPPCPDERPCVMAPPRCCNGDGNCGTDPVPTCGLLTISKTKLQTC